MSASRGGRPGECRGRGCSRRTRISVRVANTESTAPERRVTRSISRNLSAENRAQLETSSVQRRDATFRLRVRRNPGRNYRSRRSAEDDDGSEEEAAEDPVRDQVIWNISPSPTSSEDSTTTNTTFEIENDCLSEIDEDSPCPKVLLKQKPKHKWFVINEVANRQRGTGSRFQGSELFQQRCYGSLHAVQRLELMYKLEEHRGCVNNLNFNQSGSLLASASDDRKIVVWDWACGKCLLSYESGHSSNVFQAKFLPLLGDCHIVSCARDGQVRLALLSNTGVCKNTRLLAQHRRPTHKLATHPATPHVFLSAGEDALVMSHDVRLSKSDKLLTVKEGTHKVGLYSIHSNPINYYEFCVTGEDHFIRLYDTRKITNRRPMKKFCPQRLVNSDVFLHVTCAVFNYNGTEILGTFNDENIYLFDTRHSQDADYVHKYEGHRNSVTVKSVNFFGPRSEFIVSGSDCGNIYFWDKHNESIVQWMRGDEDGVVNCLEPHPQIPVIATSGLDSDIKIWVPSCEQEPAMNGLKRAVMLNMRNRAESYGRRSDPFDGQMRWLWREIQRFERRRVVTMSQPSGSDGLGDAAAARAAHRLSSSSEGEPDPDNEEFIDVRHQCSPS